MIVYIAGPIAGENIVENIKEGLKVTEMIARKNKLYVLFSLSYT